MSDRMRAYSIEGEHTVDSGPPERLEARVGQCSAVTEDGTRCRTLSLHERCRRHRQTTTWRRHDDDRPGQ
jgi:hypothetical protein